MARRVYLKRMPHKPPHWSAAIGRAPSTGSPEQAEMGWLALAEQRVRRQKDGGQSRPRTRLVESAASILADHCFSADGGKVRCHSAIPQPRSSPIEMAPAIKGRIST